METVKNSSGFCTSSMQEAAYVIAMGAELPAVRGKRGRAEFVFDDPEGELAWLGQEFNVEAENNAMCSAPKLFSAMKKLKGLMDEAFGAWSSSKR